MKNDWKPVVGYEEIYEVASSGEVRSVINSKGRTKGKLITPRLTRRPERKNATAYYTIRLTKDGKRTHRGLHRILAEAFIGKPPPNAQVNHKDGNGLNNRLSNLEYTTCAENIRHGFRTSGRNHRGIRNPAHKLTKDAVSTIRAKYKEGQKQTDLAKEFGVTQPMISRIILGKSWT